MTRTLSPTRKRLLEFLAGVALLHVVAIALYYALDVERWSAGPQRVFAWSWMGATVAIVVVGLQRIKRARRGRGNASLGRVSNRS